MTAETEQRRLELATQAEKRNQDRDNIGKLYKSIQAISTQIPNFNNPEIDKTANTILESLKLIEKWLVDEAKAHFQGK